MSSNQRLIIVGNQPVLGLASDIAGHGVGFSAIVLEPSDISTVDVIGLLGAAPRSVSVFAAIGLNALNHARSDLVRKVQLAGFALQSLIHPTAAVATSAKVGSNVLISAGASVGPDCEIEDGTVILDGARVEAGARIGAFCWLGGNVVVGFRAALGSYSIIRPGVNLDSEVSVGDHCELSTPGLRQKPIPAGVFETEMFESARLYRSQSS
jgi:acetyltransferase-like isoleucine patch superfamily enzyme